MTDEELVKRIRQGDASAGEELIDRYYAAVFRYCRCWCGHKETAEDLAQETFERFFRSLGSYRHQGKAANFLYTIAANQARNFIRKRKRDRAFSIDDDENGTPMEKDSELADQGPDADPVRSAHIADIKKRLRKAMEQLSPAHREVVTLCDVMGLSYQEISKLLHVSEGTLRSRIFYAHKQLQSLLGDIER